MSEQLTAVAVERDGFFLDRAGRPDPDAVTALQRLSGQYRLYCLELPSAADPDALLQLDAALQQAGIEFDGLLCCDCSEPCLREAAVAELVAAADAGGFDLHGVVLITDLPEMVQAVEAVGALPLYLLTERGRNRLKLLEPDRMQFHRAEDAVDWVLRHPAGMLDLDRTLDLGAEALRRGELVAFPTETVYGIGANALDPDAVQRIFTAKKRPSFNPLIVHIAEPSEVERLVTEVPEQAKELMARFWPGPLTLILPKRAVVPDIVTAGHPTVGVRMPGNRLALELIRRAGVPVAAPSANEFTCTSPTNAAHVRSQLDGLYAVLVDGGACRVGVESTVLSLTGSVPRILRPGGITRRQLEEVIGPVEVLANDSGQTVDIESPGMYPVHYAPRTPLELYRELPEELSSDPDVGWILLDAPPWPCVGPVEILSGRGVLEDAARGLYAALRHMDSLGLRLIVSHRFPDDGIGAALNDRIGKAAAREN